MNLWCKYKCEGVKEVSGQENSMKEKGQELGRERRLGFE